MAVIGPSLWLIPAFLAVLILYYFYPWMFAGEIAELMLGLSFLYASLGIVRGYRNDGSAASGLRSTVSIGGLFVLILGLGLVSEAWSSRQTATGQATVKAAEREIAALVDDLLMLTAQRGFDVPTPCGYHGRLHTLVQTGFLSEMHEATFSALKKDGLPEVRAEFFIDPWNTSYWIWHDSCDEDEHTIYNLQPWAQSPSRLDRPGPRRRRHRRDNSGRPSATGDSFQAIVAEREKRARENEAS
jgi:hypothetical protein